MLYSFINITNISSNKKIKDVQKSILFNYCDSKIKQYFPKFEENDLLTEYVTLMLIIMSEILNIKNYDGSDDDREQIFISQISMNNDRNFIALLNLFLPYIDDKNDFFNQKNVKNVIQLIEETRETNLNNKSKFSNFIYDHSTPSNFKFEKTEENIKNFEIDIINKLPDTFNKQQYYSTMFNFILDAINRIRYKFYINWINTFPISILNYKETDLYKNSWKFDKNTLKFTDSNNNLLNFPLYFNLNSITNIDIEKIILNTTKVKESQFETQIEINNLISQSQNNCIFYKGINIEDIYNTLVNDYFLSIKRSKWLLFEFSDQNNIYILIYILHDIFDINKILHHKTWNMLDDYEKSKTSKLWLELLNAGINNFGYSNYDNQIIKRMLINIVSYFKIHYNGISQLESNKIIKDLDLNLEDKDTYEDDEIFIIENDFLVFINRKNKKIPISEFLDSIINVPVEDIYTFLYDEINSIKNTPYKYLLFNESKINDNLLCFMNNNKYNKINLDDIDSYIITPKNYYNFAKRIFLKSFIGPYDEPDNLFFPNLWDSLSIEDKYIVVIRLNQTEDQQDWFKIPNVLRKIGYDESNIPKLIKVIYNKIRSQIIDMTFENLIRKGCICEIFYNPKVSDVNILTNDFKIKSERLAKNMKEFNLSEENIKKYEDAYYFSNNTKYKDIDYISIEYQGSSLQFSYLEYLSEINKTGDKWFTFYAVDWVSQIDFYLKFMNQRIMYITGSTGQGKSTQVPKLYLYGLKSLLYKNDGKIFCSVPRVDPVLENALGISKSMGLPIESFDEKLGIINTLNGTIQYKYSSDDHINYNSNFFLRIMTDGLLLQYLKSNQLLKEQKITKKQNRTNPTIKMSNKNVCDVVMIDEAHEHNANMDIILTILRHTLFYNNDIRLSIISATMEEDEPIFRKFYRFIDDNLTYPINMFNLNFGLDRNFIDRRYHISPPGETTQYTVIEHFLNDSEDTYQFNEDRAIETVNNILESTDSGEILLFSTTIKTIDKLTEKLNNIIPPNCIALPYHGQLKEEYKKISKKGSSAIKKINFDRKDVVNLFSGKISINQVTKVNEGTYKRACIIATNAAEASLTITSLKFVVDIGFQLTVKYDYDKNIPEIFTEKITEASRVQRKGRVGRVSNGEVYHMYPKGSRIEVKSEYSISLNDFSDSFVNLLCNQEIESNEIINKDVIRKLVSLQKLSNEDLDLIKKPNKSIIYNQYRIDSYYFLDNGNIKFLDYDREWNLNYSYFDFLFPSYYTGFSSSNLLDGCGHFYITNPLEREVRRDILTSNFIDINGSLLTLKIDDMKKIYNLPLINLEIVNVNNFLYKTNLNLELNQIKSVVGSYDDIYIKIITYTLLLISTKKYDNYKLLLKVIFIYNLLTKVDFDISSLIDSNKNLNINFHKHIETYNKNKRNFYNIPSYDSELDFIEHIFNKLFYVIDIDLIFRNVDFKNSDLSDKLVNFISTNFVNLKNILEFSKNNNLNRNDTNLIMKLFLKANFSLDSLNEEYLSYNSLIDENLVNNFSINQILQIFDLNYEIIYDIIITSISDYKLLINKVENLEEPIDNLVKILSLNYNSINNIKSVFFNSNLSNIYYQEEGQFKHLISSECISPEFGTLNSTSTFGFYLKYDPEKKKIFFLSNLTKIDILKTAPQLVGQIKGNGKKYLNYEDLENNKQFLASKLSNFSYENKKIQFNEFEDFNISNILIRRTMENTKLLDQEGGFFYVIQKPFKLMKLHINTIKKDSQLMELIKMSNIDIDKYDFGYVARSNLDNNKLIGFYLVERIAFNAISINKIIDYYPEFKNLLIRLRMRGVHIFVEKN